MARAPQTLTVEETPEADRLEGFPHPRTARQVFGHDAAERMLAEAVAVGRLHHGWLITGREGIGKATLAYRFAKHVLARAEERDPLGGLAVAETTTAARQVMALSHPGLLVIRRPWLAKDKRFAASIPIDEVRRLRTFLALSAGEGAWRVVIVDTADELNLNAANALLKSLEEPPPRTVFLLVSSEPGRLLPTIRSRCRTLPLDGLAGDDLRRAVRQVLAESETGEPTPSEWKTLDQLAQGSVRRLLQLRAAGGLDLYARVVKLVSGLPAIDWAAVHALADELGGTAAEQRFELFFDLLLDRVARLVRAAAGAPGGSGAEGEPSSATTGIDTAEAARLVGAERLATYAELWERVARAKAETLALNLDRKTLILETVRELGAAARS